MILDPTSGFLRAKFCGCPVIRAGFTEIALALFGDASADKGPTIAWIDLDRLVVITDSLLKLIEL